MTARSVGPAIDGGPQPGRPDDVRSSGQSRHQPHGPTLPLLTQLRHRLRGEPNLENRFPLSYPASSNVLVASDGLSLGLDRAWGMQRRDFIMALGLAAVWPLAVQAQQPKKVPRIGFLTTGSLELPETRVTLNAFRQGLRELGYFEGQNIVIEVRAADSKIERFPALASELVGLKVDVIVAHRTRSPAVLHSTRPPRSPLLSRLWAIQLQTGSSPTSRDRAGILRG